MSKMPFLPYLRMHTLNLEPSSDSEPDDVRERAETTDTRSRSTRVGDDAARIDCMDAYAATDVIRFRSSRR